MQREDGAYRLSWPLPEDVKMPYIWSKEDTGKWVAAIIKSRSSLLSAHVMVAAGWWSAREIIDAFKEGTGKSVEYVWSADEEWKDFIKSRFAPLGMDERLAQSYLETWQFIEKYQYFGPDAEENTAKAYDASSPACGGLRSGVNANVRIDDWSSAQDS